MTANERRLAMLRGDLVIARADLPVHPSTENVERVCRILRPHLYDGYFAKLLASTGSMFTPAQAEESAAAKREEYELEVEQVLLYFLNGGAS